jgi:hypothetical protein
MGFDKIKIGLKNTNKNFKHTFSNYSVVSRWQICNVIASDSCNLPGLVESPQGVSTFFTAILAHRTKLILSF